MNEFLAVTVVITLAAISPGPDFALVIKNSLQYNRSSGILTALGISCSLLIHALYCILGLAIIIAHSLWLFNCIKYLGAFYLIYLGLKSLRSRCEEKLALNDEATRKPFGPFKSFLQGLLCNLLNPKAILFIVAFFTLVVKPEMSWSVQLAYCLEIAFIHFIWFSCLSALITYQRVREKISTLEYYVIKAMGVVLIGFGARVAMLKNMV
ncbi:LysE family transporter [Legionella sp.]|uniref:LysE family translocator n=1 Tax=Legionella sp. TaxID=459 RepID=UPI0032209C9F